MEQICVECTAPELETFQIVDAVGSQTYGSVIVITDEPVTKCINTNRKIQQRPDIKTCDSTEEAWAANLRSSASYEGDHFCIFWMSSTNIIPHLGLALPQFDVPRERLERCEIEIDNDQDSKMQNTLVAIVQQPAKTADQT